MRKPAIQPLPQRGNAPRRLLALFFTILAPTVLLPLSRASLPPPPLLYKQLQREGAPGPERYARFSLELPALEEYFLLFQAQAALPTSEGILGLQQVIALRPESPAAFEAHLALARHFASSGDSRAEEEYHAALELEDSAALRQELAGFLEAEGRREEAYQEYKTLLQKGTFPEAFIGMRRLAQDPLTLAQNLIDASYFSDALEVLRTETAPESYPLFARAHFGIGDYEEARSFYELWLESEPANETAKIGLARTLARLGEYNEALEIYQEIDTADSLLEQGEILKLLGETEEALEVYQELLGRGVYPLAWWQAATILEQEDRVEEALPFYRAVARTQNNLADDAAYRLFILAQRLGGAEMQEEALAILDRLVPNHLAFLATGQEFAPVLAPPAPPAAADVLEKPAALRYLGLHDLARRELLYVAHFRESQAVDLTVAQALYSQGDTLDGHRIAQEILDGSESASLPVWRLAYPIPYLAEVEVAAAEFNLDPLLIYAMMRAESRYDPQAVSPAYAQGLMQIIPSTRDWIAEQLGLELTPVDIFDPAINIRLGAFYLRFVLDFFDQDVEFALAAYNGGPGNVGNWLDDPLVQDKADFYRWIGLGQTREYLSIVLLNYRIYQWLEGQGAPRTG